MARARSTALLTTSTVRAFGGALPPTMPSADFCAAVRPPCDDLSPVAGTQRRPPEVRPTAFAARPPDLPPRPLMTLDFATVCSLVRPGRPRYPVLVHRAAALLHAFFRPHLAMMPLRFANPSPPSGWVEDFHLQAVVHTRHTNKTGDACASPAVFVVRLGSPLKSRRVAYAPLRNWSGSTGDDPLRISKWSCGEPASPDWPDLAIT
ncbi:hypothetical protein ABIE91_008528 [Bradyrhizobium elkanii]